MPRANNNRLGLHLIRNGTPDSRTLHSFPWLYIRLRTQSVAPPEYTHAYYNLWHYEEVLQLDEYFRKRILGTIFEGAEQSKDHDLLGYNGIVDNFLIWN
jgi:hypothetical protein